MRDLLSLLAVVGASIALSLPFYAYLRYLTRRENECCPEQAPEPGAPE